MLTTKSVIRLGIQKSRASKTMLLLVNCICGGTNVVAKRQNLTKGIK